MRFKLFSLFFTALALLLSTFILPSSSNAAGHVVPSGVTEGEASQLITWYDQSESPPQFGESFFQVTNGSIDTAVNIHVQIFADNVEDSSDLCREHDFTDTLTPNDTAAYSIGELDESTPGPPFFTGDNSGNPIAIDVVGTRGFIVVTAVDSVTLPRQAISHNHLYGNIFIGGDVGPGLLHRINAMGRLAVDFATGAALDNGILLDGINTGLALVQPSIIEFDYFPPSVTLMGFVPTFYSINSIAFADNYSDPNGEYRATPTSAVWDPLIFDYTEVGTSCQQRVNTCFASYGLNDLWTAVIDPFDSSSSICPANEFEVGWVKIAVSGLAGLDNALGVTGFVTFAPSTISLPGVNLAGATWMIAE